MNNITASTTKMKTGLVLFMASLLLVIGVVLTQGDAYAHNYQPSPTPSPTPSPSMSPTPKPSPTPSPTPSPSPSPSPSPTPTPTPVASPSPSATPTTIVINNHQEQKQEQHNNQTVNINTGTTAKVGGVKTPAKTPDTGVSVLGMASMFGAGPLGFALMRYGRGRIGSNREESLSEQALNLLNKRTGEES